MPTRRGRKRLTISLRPTVYLISRTDRQTRGRRVSDPSDPMLNSLAMASRGGEHFVDFRALAARLSEVGFPPPRRRRWAIP